MFLSVWQFKDLINYLNNHSSEVMLKVVNSQSLQDYITNFKKFNENNDDDIAKNYEELTVHKETIKNMISHLKKGENNPLKQFDYFLDYMDESGNKTPQNSTNYI